MFDLSGQQVLLRIAAMLVIIAAHGWLVAALAVLMGDRGPRYDGRLSLNPLRHLELIGALTLVLFRVGWIKPVAVDPGELRSRFGGMVVIVLGSLLLTVAVAEVLWLLRPTLLTAFSDTSVIRTLVLFIETMARMTVWFAIVNLVPIPPLTGGLFLAVLAPGAYRFLDGKRIFVAIALAAIAFTGAAVDVLDGAVNAVANVVLR